jgi:hypothetical protein
MEAGAAPDESGRCGGFGFRLKGVADRAKEDAE